jgi:hypothetical protein
LVIWPCSEAHSANFLVIQTHLFRRFYLAVDFLGLRRSGSSSQIINQAQDFLEQAPRHRHLGQLECDVPAWLTTFAPIFTNFSRSVVSDQCFTSFGEPKSSPGYEHAFWRSSRHVGSSAESRHCHDCAEVITD